MPCRTRSDEMTTFAVYRVDKVRDKKVRVGTLVERRRRDRGNNIAGLLKLAANRFKLSSGHTIQIVFGGILVEM
jgi:hypothetical protein